MGYSIDLRERVIGFVKQGGSRREAARRFAVNHQTVNNWMSRPTAAKPGPKAPRVDTVKLAKHIEQHHDMYLEERAKVFGMSPSGMWRAMNRLKHTFKKPSATPK